jgi:hypothetical protein
MKRPEMSSVNRATTKSVSEKPQTKGELQSIIYRMVLDPVRVQVHIHDTSS